MSHLWSTDFLSKEGIKHKEQQQQKMCPSISDK